MVIGIVDLPRIVNQTPRTDGLAPRRDIDVVPHRVHRDDPFGFTVFRAEHHPRANGVRRFLNIDRLPVDKYLAAGNAGAAKQPFHQLAAPCPHQPEQADDFTAAHGKADGRAYARGFHLFQTQQLATVLTRFPVVNIAQLAAYHRLHQLVVVDLLHIGEGANITAIFEYGNGIAEGEDLFHTV